MGILSFEDVIAWQKAKELAKNIYNSLKNNRDFSFKDQLQRAAISVGNNIAEGFERRTNKELKQFLYIAKGSCGEVRSMLYLALELSYINEEEFRINYQLSIEISKLLAGFAKKLN